MNPETIIAQLEQINSWRRGEESEPQPDPKHVGEVIDAAVASLRSLIASNTTLREQRDATRAELKLRKADVTRMEEYLRNSGRNMDEAQEQIAERDAKISELSADLARVTAANAKLSHELYEHRVSTDQYAKELAALRARVTEVEVQAERYRLATLRQDADLARVTAEREAEFRRSDSELAAAAQKESALRARAARKQGGAA